MNEHTTFDTAGPVVLVVELSAGDVMVEATDTSTTVVDLEPRSGHGDAQALVDDARVEQRIDEIRVLLPRRKRFGRQPEVQAGITVPRGSTVRIQTDSADVRVAGTVSEAQVTTASGEVALERVTGSAVVKTASGDIDVEWVGGPCTIKAASGDVDVREASAELRVDSASGDVRVGALVGSGALTTASGDISVREAVDIHCRAASGDVVLDEVRAGTVSVGTVSGDVRIGVGDGVTAWLDVSSSSGDVDSSLVAGEPPEEGQPVVDLKVRTMSGDVSLRRA